MNAPSVPRRVVVAMSGGVDSSVAALLLARQGHEVIGAHMRLAAAPQEPDVAGARGRLCCSSRDAEDARAAARILGIPFYVLDMHEEFKQEVLQPFIHAYLSGRTPNPCILCNERIKLGVLLKCARACGVEALATGHYARVRPAPRSSGYELRRAADRTRDQSYYLFALSQEQLAAFLTPLGEMTKDEVRAIARERGLPVSEKPASQDICFVQDGDYRRFLGESAGPLPTRDLDGPIVDRAGNVLGRHAGIHLFTIGQRHGLGISARQPLYVVELRPSERAVVVGEAAQLQARALETGPVNWVSVAGLAGSRRARVQIRYRHAAAPATLLPLESGGVRVEFDAPQRAVTPGQAAVLYDESDAVLLGGGWIEKAFGSGSSSSYRGHD